MAPPNIGINVTRIFLIAALGIIMLFGVIFPGVHAVYNIATEARQAETVYSRPNWELREHRAGERAHLVGYRWTEKQKNQATIPLTDDPVRPGDEFNALEQYLKRLGERRAGKGS